jgi:hypothetical protein
MQNISLERPQTLHLGLLEVYHSKGWDIVQHQVLVRARYIPHTDQNLLFGRS